ncbi:MAG: tetratricopeptide repeat protein [Alphaproteobacteria bacterium]|nr:tetratricopeptide repeat protein [Alphaproteobacteria bacterium]
MSNLEQKAAVLYNEKKYPEALDIYLSLYQKSPKTEKYSVFCGNCFDAMGESEQAISYYKKATRLNPVSETSLIALSNIYYNRADYENAVKFARRLLRKSPDNASALLCLGNIAYCKSDYETALHYYETVYKNNNASYIAVINMANTFYDLLRYVKAVDFAKKALKLYPSSVDAYIILGNSYIELEKHEKAEKSLLRALEFKDDNPWIYNALSRLYQKTERWESALETGWNAVICTNKTHQDQHINFGYLLYECVDEKGKELAERYAQKWLNRYPDEKIVSYMATSILNNEHLKSADADYVKKIFDAFAGDFDSTLSGLEYQVPEHIAGCVKANFYKPFYKHIKYLDLGCGTGLCGKAVKAVIGWSHVTGVDLSEKMLLQAKSKYVYDRLAMDEIINFLSVEDKKYHLITAGDVFTYFGDLQKLINLISLALADNGQLVFTVSDNYINSDDYHLTPSGRFVHNSDYVLKVLKKNGLKKLSVERKPLRNEGDRVIYGFVIAAQKFITIEK